MVTTTYNGIQATQVTEEVRESDRALRVLMITREWPTPERPELATFVARQADFVRAAGATVDVFVFQGSQNPLNYVRAWRQLQKKLRESRYDLIHAQWGQSGLLALPKRFPLVVTFRGCDLEGIVGSDSKYTTAGRVLTRLSKMVALAADEIITVSDSLGKRLPQGCKYHIIPSGLNLDLFCPAPKEMAREKLGLPKDRRLILFGGSPSVPRKRYKLAEEAVALLNGRFDAELVVVPGLPHHMVPSYMNACDALLLASMHEGSPNVVKEALACNLPVVSVDVGDVRERIGSLPGCVVCQDDRPETIAAGLAEVLSRDVPFEGRTAVQPLDERVLTQKVLGIYQNAMQRWKK
jgi:teichuronic acid biosynthesis glycosyltransferase TuaC